MPSKATSPDGGLDTPPKFPPQVLVMPPATPPGSDCSHCIMLSCVVRLVAQSDWADGDSGTRVESVDSAYAASGFWYPSWMVVPLIRHDQAPVVEPPQA